MSKTKVSLENKIEDKSLRGAIDQLEEMANKGIGGNMEMLNRTASNRTIDKMSELKPYIEEGTDGSHRLVIRVGKKIKFVNLNDI